VGRVRGGLLGSPGRARGEAMHRERPGRSLARKANGRKSRIVNLPAENSITQRSDQHWKSALRFGVWVLSRNVQRAQQRMSKISERLAEIPHMLHLFSLQRTQRPDFIMLYKYLYGRENTWWLKVLLSNVERQRQSRRLGVTAERPRWETRHTLLAAALGSRARWLSTPFKPISTKSGSLECGFLHVGPLQPWDRSPPFILTGPEPATGLDPGKQTFDECCSSKSRWGRWKRGELKNEIKALKANSN